MHLIPGIIAFGIYSASLIALGAVGFTLQFGVTNALNLAFGSIMTAATFIDFYVGGGSTNIWLGIGIGAASGAMLSWFVGAVVVRSFTRRGSTLFGLAMVMIALSLIIQYTLEGIQGPLSLTYHEPPVSSIHIGPVVMSGAQLVIIGSAVVLVLAVHLLLRYTRLGLAMRAVSIDPALSRSCGVPTETVRTLAWLISGALCGVAGVLLGLSTGAFDSTLSTTLFITIVAAAIIGGIGHPYGAMLGALVIGIVSEAASAVWSPDYKDVVAWSILILVLLFRPQGIFKEFASERKLVE